MSSNQQQNHRSTNRVSPPAAGGGGGGGPPGGLNNNGTASSNSRKRKQDEVAQDDSSNNVALVRRADTKEIHEIVSKRLWSPEPHVISVAMESLYDLLHSENNNAYDNQKTAFHCGAPIVIIKAMNWSEDYGYAANVRIRACWSIGFISKFQGSHETILGIGGLSAFLQAMDKHPHSPNLQAAALFLIGTMFRGSSSVRKAVVDQGGLAAVMKAMKNHKGNIVVQCNGSYALQVLIRMDAPSTWPKAAVDAGGIESIIEAMSNHPDDSNIQINGCDFLRILAKSHEDYRECILQAKGLVSIVEALRIHKNNKDVADPARAACSAIIGIQRSLLH